MFVIEQPIPPAPTTDSASNVLAKWNAVYDAHNEVACLMLGSMTLELHRQFENYYHLYDDASGAFNLLCATSITSLEKDIMDLLEHLGLIATTNLV
ncbi:hypothetical protein Tco_0512196 [Tanacetum coccineum]